MNKEKLMRLAERTLKRTEAYQENRDMGVAEDKNFQIDYLLVKGNMAAPEDLIVYASSEDELLRLRPLDENEKPLTSYEMFFEYDFDLFKYLEQGYSLAGMSLDCHYCVWFEISEYHKDFESQNGMQKYLDYCKRNGVTRELLANNPDYVGMATVIDVMTLYDKEASKKAKPPQGYER